MVVAIRDGHCTSFAEAVQLWPISAFKNHRAIKNLLLDTQVKARRVEEIFGNQPFQTLTENWHGKNGRERQVYTTITDFLNQKFVNHNTHKRYTGLWIFSRLNSLGKTALLKTLAEIGRIVFIKLGTATSRTILILRPTRSSGTWPMHLTPFNVLLILISLAEKIAI